MESASDDKRELIRQAAIQVFSRRGFHACTVEDVAQAAGVGKGTVYRYFPGKQALVEDIFRCSVDLYLAAVEATRSREPTLDRQLQSLVTHALSMAQDHQPLVSLFLEGASGMSDDFKCWLMAKKKQLLGRLALLLDQAQSRQEIASVDSQLWAHLIIGGINSLITTVLWGDGPREAAERRELALKVVEQWRQGLPPAPAPGDSA